MSDSNYFQPEDSRNAATDARNLGKIVNGAEYESVTLRTSQQVPTVAERFRALQDTLLNAATDAARDVVAVDAAALAERLKESRAMVSSLSRSLADIGGDTPAALLAPEGSALAYYAGNPVSYRTPGGPTTAIRDMLGAGAFPTPKLVRAYPGAELALSPSNLIMHSGDFAESTWTATQIIVEPRGLLVASGTAPSVYATVAAVSTARDMTLSVRVDAAENNPAAYAFVEINTGTTLARVWIDTATGSISHADPGLTARLETPPSGSDPLGNATFLAISFTLAAFDTFYPTLGMSDASQMTAATAGKGVVFSQPHVVLGDDVKPYYESGESGISVPVDYTTGAGTVPIEASDAVAIPASVFPWAAGSDFSVFVEFIAPKAGEVATIAMTQNADNLISLIVNDVGTVVLELRTGSVSDDRTTTVLGTVKPEAVVPLAFSLSEKGFLASLNREPPVRFSRHGRLASGAYRSVQKISPAALELNAAGTGAIGLRRMAMLGRALDETGEEIRTFGMTAPHPFIEACHPVVEIHEKVDGESDTSGLVPLTDRTVEGGAYLIDSGETSGTAVIGTISVQRKAFGQKEKPGRLVARRLAWTPGMAIEAGDLTVFDQPDEWVNDDGHMQHGAGIVRTYGPEKGTEYVFYTEAGEVPVGGNPEEEPRSIYVRKRESQLSPWGVKTLVVAPADLTFSSSFVLTSPTGRSIQFPDDHPNAGRFGFTIYTFAGGGDQFVYTDDEGATWSVGPPPASVFGTVYGIESSPVLAPNGEVLLFSRAIASTLGKVWQTMLVSRAGNGGADAAQAEHVLLSDVASFESQGGSLTGLGHTLGYEGGALTASAVQLDPTGIYDKTVGVVAIVAAKNTPDGGGIERQGLMVYVVGGPNYKVLASAEIVSDNRTIGANSTALLEFGGRQCLAILAGTGIGTSTNDRTGQELVIVCVPEWRDALI